MQLNEQLRIIRQSQRVTQKEMAHYCGCSQNCISAMESGQHKIRIDILVGYATRLHLSIDSLLELPSNREFPILPELLQAIGEMSAAEQADLLRIIDIMRRRRT